MADIKKRIEETFSVCEKCGYTTGFHVSFRKEKDDGTVIILLCPQCKQSYDVGWQV